ncbi:MAG: hypothetical protein V4615_08390 [Bacteroidota bacterium]
MKKLSVILTAILLTTAYSCNKLKHVKFTVPFTAEMTVPKTDVINTTHTVFSDTVETNINTIASDNKTSKDLVRSVKFDEVVLVIKEPADQTFDFVKDFHVYIWTPGQPEAEVSFKTDMSENGRELIMDINDREFKQYFVSDWFQIKATAYTTKPIVQDIKIDAKIKARFEADLLEIFK